MYGNEHRRLLSTYVTITPTISALPTTDTGKAVDWYAGNLISLISTLWSSVRNVPGDEMLNPMAWEDGLGRIVMVLLK